MAKMRNAKPKHSSDGYLRLVGDEKLAEVFKEAQSTVISNGTELENIISSMAKTINDLNDFIRRCDEHTVENGVYLCIKKVLKKSNYALKGNDPDFLAFALDTTNNICYVVELKDGDTFDTKKATAEKEQLIKFVNNLAPKIPFRTNYYVCCFNQTDKNEIIKGFKNKLTLDEVMTGKEFCDILNINYESIINNRKEDAKDNFAYTIEKLAKMKAIQDNVIKKHRKHILEDQFY